MKNKLNKQILSALLAVLILVSAFPNTAYSVENETEPTDEDVDVQTDADEDADADTDVVEDEESVEE